MFVKVQSRLGDWIGERKIQAYNRTGATVNKYDLVQLDLAASDGDVTAYATWIAGTSPDSSASPLANFINSTTAQLNKGGIWGVVLDDSVADNSKATLLLSGVTKIEMVGSSGVTINTGIMPVNAQTYVADLTDGNASVGWALEAGPTGAVAAAWCIFDGICLQTTGG